MVAPVTFEGGITVEGGITIGNVPLPTPPGVVLSLDAGNPASYPGSGSTWTDTVGSIPFTLVNSPAYSSSNGGYLQFDPGSGQYGYSTTNLGTLATWSIEAWHYYDGTNTSSGPNIFTEYSYGGGTINLGLGCGGGGDTDLQAWWYGAGFHATPGYTLTPGNWYQIVGTFDGTTLNLYVNNTLVQTATEPPGGAANPAIGYGLMTRWDPGGLWGGRLAILKLYNADIGAGGVTTSYNANRARFGLAATPPTLDITAHSFGSGNPNGSITFNITNDGGGTVLETGVIYGLPGQTTYALSTDSCTGSSSSAERTAIRTGGCPGPYTTGLTGSQTVSFSANQFIYETIDVLAYARNSVGVAYSPTVLSWIPQICLAEGTLITLADESTTAIENIQMSDLIKVWDFDNGVFASAHPLWIKQQETTARYNLLTFSDGSTLKTINQHRIFNKQAGAFTYPMTDDTPIGTITVNAQGEEVSLVGKTVVDETVNYYNVITDYHMNLYANGILTSLRFNNVYDINEMKFVKDGRALRSLSEFADIDSRWVDGLRLREQQQPIETISKYVARLERMESEVCYA